MEDIFLFCFCMCRSILYLFFSFSGLSPILLVKYLSLKITYAKILVSYEIIATLYFVTFSLANILNISCRLPFINKRFQAKFFNHTPFPLIKKDRCIFETNFSIWRQFSDIETNIISLSALQSLYPKCTQKGSNLMTKNFLFCCLS